MFFQVLFSLWHLWNLHYSVFYTFMLVIIFAVSCKIQNIFSYKIAILCDVFLIRNKVFVSI